jgi:hypothetical protein
LEGKEHQGDHQQQNRDTDQDSFGNIPDHACLRFPEEWVGPDAPTDSRPAGQRGGLPAAHPAGLR